MTWLVLQDCELQKQVDEQSDKHHSTNHWSPDGIRRMGQDPLPGHGEEQEGEDGGDDGRRFPSLFQERHAEQ